MVRDFCINPVSNYPDLLLIILPELIIPAVNGTVGILKSAQKFGYV